MILRLILVVSSLMVLGGCNESPKTSNNWAGISDKSGGAAIWRDSLEQLYPAPNVRELAEAVGAGKLNKIERLVRGGVSASSQGLYEVPILFWAYRNKNLSGAIKLMELGANPNVIFNTRTSLLHLASRQGEVKFLEAFLNFEADPNLVAGNLQAPPIFEAIDIYGEYGNFEIIDLLLNAGANPNAQSAEGNTVMMMAVRLGRIDIAYHLLVNGADPKIQNVNGENLVSVMNKKEETLDKQHEIYSWYKKVESLLNENN